MKRHKISLPSIVMLFGIVALTGCGMDQNEPTNNISDRKGLSIDLGWTTHSNLSAALAEVDLDLDIFKDDKEILSSYNAADFEHVDLASLLEDGIYTVKVSFYEVSKRSDYILNVRGNGTGKTFRTSGFFDAGEKEQAISILKIIKSGKHFTLAAV